MFTSGTTSRPKAVVHTHANAIWASRTGPRNIDLTTDDTYIIFLPFFHVNAQSWSLFSVFGVGATAVLMPKWSQSRFWPMVVEHGVTHTSVMPFVMGALGSPDKPAGPHAARRRVRADPARPRQDVRDRRVRRVRHDRDGHALHHRQVVGEAADAVDGPRHPGLRDRGRRPGHRRAVRRGRDRRAVDARHPRHPAVPRVLRQRRGQRQGVRGRLVQDRRHGEDGRGRQRLLPGARQGPAQGRRRERVGQGGRGPHRRPPRGAVGRRRRQAARVPERGRGGVRDPGARRPRPRRSSPARSSPPCTDNLASFKVPRAVYFVEEFPTGTLDKILKNKLREMADEHPAVD